MIKHDNAFMVVDTETSRDDWCTYEHLVTIEEGAPPTVLMVGACKLTHVYNLADGKRNSEWVNMFRNGGQVLVRIAATGNKHDMFKYAHQLVQQYKPIANVQGHNLKSARRAVVCITNDKRYDSQIDAANDLGLHQSAISRHLKGELKSVSGFQFIYAPD